MSDRLLSGDEIDTYLSAVDWLIDLLGSTQVASAWHEPSSLANYTVGGVAAHAVQAGVVRLEQSLELAEPTSHRVVKVEEYYGPARLVNPGDDNELFVSLRAAAEAFATEGQPGIVASCVASREHVARLLPMSRADRGIPSIRLPDGQVPLEDYLRTRVLELIVHGDDVVTSVTGWRPSDPPPDAVTACLGVCLDLARARVGDVATVRAFTRSERATPGALRIL
jgi:hypothetical protein